MRDERCGVKAKGAGEVLEEQRVRGGVMGGKGEHQQLASHRLA